MQNEDFPFAFLYYGASHLNQGDASPIQYNASAIRIDWHMIRDPFLENRNIVMLPIFVVAILPFTFTLVMFFPCLSSLQP